MLHHKSGGKTLPKMKSGHEISKPSRNHQNAQFSKTLGRFSRQKTETEGQEQNDMEEEGSTMDGGTHRNVESDAGVKIQNPAQKARPMPPISKVPTCSFSILSVLLFRVADIWYLKLLIVMMMQRSICGSLDGH